MDSGEDRCLVYLVCFVYLVHLVSFWLFWFNQTNQINERDQMNRSPLDRRKVANDDLGNFLKIAVRCQDRKPVLHGAGGNPDIVGSNRGAGLLEEGRDDGPSIRGFVVDSEDAHSGRSEKLS